MSQAFLACLGLHWLPYISNSWLASNSVLRLHTKRCKLLDNVFDERLLWWGEVALICTRDGRCVVFEGLLVNTEDRKDPFRSYLPCLWQQLLHLNYRKEKAKINR
jgi:hypothetical protein